MDIIKKGIERIMNKSKILLVEMKEFAPFGIIYKNDEWINLETYDENFDSMKMRDFLMNTIHCDFKNKDCLFGAVCINAVIDNTQEVIIIYNTSNGQDWYELIYAYSTNGREIKIWLYE